MNYMERLDNMLEGLLDGPVKVYLSYIKNDGAPNKKEKDKAINFLKLDKNATVTDIKRKLKTLNPFESHKFDKAMNVNFTGIFTNDYKSKIMKDFVGKNIDLNSTILKTLLRHNVISQYDYDLYKLDEKL